MTTVVFLHSIQKNLGSQQAACCNNLPPLNSFLPFYEKYPTVSFALSGRGHCHIRPSSRQTDRQTEVTAPNEAESSREGKGKEKEKCIQALNALFYY